MEELLTPPEEAWEGTAAPEELQEEMRTAQRVGAAPITVRQGVQGARQGWD